MAENVSENVAVGNIEQEIRDRVKRERPLSPHLSIYKPQITSVLSISHRITGVLLFFGLLVLCWFLIFSAFPEDKVSTAIASCMTKCFMSTIGKLFILMWSFCLFYHMANGIRHLFWDMGKGFELKTVTTSGIAVILFAVGATAASWIIFLTSIN